MAFLGVTVVALFRWRRLPAGRAPAVALAGLVTTVWAGAAALVALPGSAFVVLEAVRLAAWVVVLAEIARLWTVAASPCVARP